MSEQYFDVISLFIKSVNENNRKIQSGKCTNRLISSSYDRWTILFDILPLMSGQAHHSCAQTPEPVYIVFLVFSDWATHWLIYWLYPVITQIPKTESAVDAKQLLISNHERLFGGCAPTPFVKIFNFDEQWTNIAWHLAPRTACP